jgi:hypothetical protein
MRPVLKPGIRRLWRDGSTLQLGVDPSRALIISGITPAVAAVIDSLDGSRAQRQRADPADATTSAVLSLLAEAGMIDDAVALDDTPPGPGPDRERLRPDLAALSLSTREPDGSRRLARRRHHSRIRVRGAGRVGAHIATLLAAAGVGQVIVDDAGLTGAADVAPGGLRLEDVGRPRSLAADAALARVIRRPTAPPHGGGPFRPDLIVVAPTGLPVLRPDESLDLEQRGIPHLLAGVRETTGVVGPLVIPGRTSCLHCQHLHRNARDPAWPLLALQLARRADTGPDACDVTLAALVSSLAAMQALAYVDGRQDIPEPPGTAQDDGGADRATGRSRRAGPAEDGAGQDTADETFGTPHRPAGGVPVTADGTLEFAMPDWRIRRRSWPVHAHCPCRSALRPAPLAPSREHPPAHRDERTRRSASEEPRISSPAHHTTRPGRPVGGLARAGRGPSRTTAGDQPAPGGGGHVEPTHGDPMHRS